MQDNSTLELMQEIRVRTYEKQGTLNVGSQAYDNCRAIDALTNAIISIHIGLEREIIIEDIAASLKRI